MKRADWIKATAPDGRGAGKRFYHPRRTAEWGEVWAPEETNWSLRADQPVEPGEVEALLRVERSA